MNDGRSPAAARATDYRTYRASPAQKILAITVAAAGLFACGWTAYGSPWAGAAAAALSAFAPRMLEKGLCRKRRKALLLQFRDALQSISSSLSAGRSVENAFAQAAEDLAILYCGTEEPILAEIRRINRRVETGGTLSAALDDFAARAGIRDVSDFAEVFAICVRNGGNLIEVIRNTCAVIRQKIDTAEEISILAAEKLLSFRVMMAMPALFAALMMTGSPDYMRLLYAPAGRVAVSVALAVIAAAWAIGRRMAAGEPGEVL